MKLLLGTRGAGATASARSVRGQLDMTFDVEAKDLGTARNVVRAYLCWWGIDDGAASRTLTVVNELLTNVLQHTPIQDNGSRKARLLIQRVPDGVTAVVSDNDPRPPTLATPDPFAEDGRGLMLVRAMTDDMSVSGTPTGKDVWVFLADSNGTW